VAVCRYVTCIQGTLQKKSRKSPVRRNQILARKRIFAIFSPFSGRNSPKCCLTMQTPIVHLNLKSVCRYFQKRNLAGNLNANFGGKIQIDVFPVSGFRSSPNFTLRRSLGTCIRRTNPLSTISNRSKVIQEKPFPEIAEIRFLRSNMQKFPTQENPRVAVPPASYPHSICVGLPNFKKICSNVFEQLAAGTTH
jgi:hypothetical protein